MWQKQAIKTWGIKNPNHSGRSTLNERSGICDREVGSLVSFTQSSVELEMISPFKNILQYMCACICSVWGKTRIECQYLIPSWKTQLTISSYKITPNVRLVFCNLIFGFVSETLWKMLDTSKQLLEWPKQKLETLRSAFIHNQ